MSEMSIIDTLSATKLALIEELNNNSSPDKIFADYLDACGPRTSSETIKSNAPHDDTQKNLSDNANKRLIFEEPIINGKKVPMLHWVPVSPKTPDSGLGLSFSQPNSPTSPTKLSPQFPPTLENAKDQAIVEIKEFHLENVPIKEIKARKKSILQNDNLPEDNFLKLKEGECPDFNKALAIFKDIEAKNASQKEKAATQVRRERQEIINFRIPRPKLIIPSKHNDIELSFKIPLTDKETRPKVVAFNPSTDNIPLHLQIRGSTTGSVDDTGVINVDDTGIISVDDTGIINADPLSESESQPPLYGKINKKTKTPVNASLQNKDVKHIYESLDELYGIPTHESIGSLPEGLEKNKPPTLPARKYFVISEKGQHKEETAEELFKELTKTLDDIEKNEEWDKMYDAIDELMTGACQGLGLSKAHAQVYEDFLLHLYNAPQERPYGALEKLTIAGKSLDLERLVKLENNKVTANNERDRPATPEIQWEIPTRLFKICLAQYDKVAVENIINASAKTNNVEPPLKEVKAPKAAKAVKKANAKIKNENIANYTSDTPNSTNEPITAANRFITQAELDSYIKKINDENIKKNNKAAPIFHGAWAPTKINNGPEFSYEIDNIKSVMLSNNPGSQTANFSPILLGDHWYLFGTFYVNNVKHALVYDSNGNIKKDEDWEFFIKFSRNCSVQKELIIISDNLQENSPNACGLFVANAMRVINNEHNEHNEHNGNYEAALDEANRDYHFLDEASQVNYNLTGRKELLEIMNARIRQLSDEV